jgi:hypothetical protein
LSNARPADGVQQFATYVNDVGDRHEVRVEFVGGDLLE